VSATWRHRWFLLRRLTSRAGPATCLVLVSGLLGAVGQPGACASPEKLAASFLSIPQEQLQRLASHRPRQANLLAVQQGRPALRITVDLEHQRVSAVYYLSRLDPRPVPVSDDALGSSRRSARQYAARFCPELNAPLEFDTEMPVPNVKQCNSYLFMWQERAGTAYTGKVLTIRVAPATYEIQSALLRLPPKGPLREPRITEETAIAMAHQASRILTDEQVTIIAARLVLSHVAAPDEGPAWLVDIRPVSGRWRDVICIDAHNGRLIYPQSSDCSHGNAADE